MKLNEYQAVALTTANHEIVKDIVYPTLGLNGEAGEVAEKVKKVIRDKGGVFTDEDKRMIALELGDVLWYLSSLADALDFTLCEIAEMNLNKVTSRRERGVLSGSGDLR